MPGLPGPDGFPGLRGDEGSEGIPGANGIVGIDLLNRMVTFSLAGSSETQFGTVTPNQWHGVVLEAKKNSGQILENNAGI